MAPHQLSRGVAYEDGHHSKQYACGSCCAPRQATPQKYIAVACQTAPAFSIGISFYLLDFRLMVQRPKHEVFGGVVCLAATGRDINEDPEDMPEAARTKHLSCQAAQRTHPASPVTCRLPCELLAAAKHLGTVAPTVLEDASQMQGPQRLPTSCNSQQAAGRGL